MRSLPRPVTTRPDPAGALSAAQTKAALTLAYGGTVSAAADSAGVHRSSIYNWFKNDPNFKQAVEDIQRDRHERLSDQMRELEALALARLRRILEDDSVPASVQLRAALAILNRPKESSGREDWNVPRMESLSATLERKPLLADTTRQISTLFAVSPQAEAGAPQPLRKGLAATSLYSLRPMMAQSRPPKNSARNSPGSAASAVIDSTAGER
jgi:AcrR family transcriptional regulator